MADDTPIDRHDLQALKDWMGAKFETIEAKFVAQEDATRLLAEDRKAIDEHLNDVRTRFVDKQEYKAFTRRAGVAAGVIAVGIIVDLASRLGGGVT